MAVWLQHGWRAAQGCVAEPLPSSLTPAHAAPPPLQVALEAKLAASRASSKRKKGCAIQ